MREFKRYNHDERHHRKHYNRSYGKYNNSNRNDENKTNSHYNRINKNNGRGPYNNYDERIAGNERNSQVRVMISNLDYTISKNDLVELFSNVCKVVNAWINYDHTDRSDGTAVCIFENISDAQKAIDKYDEIEGLSMKMEIMHRRNYGYRKKYKSRCPW
ncbi:RNA and export factor binding protein, putative [Plasmodium malariae]|uniref:RNA and export factor binding protein, putative n=1 Tax=Plasmodium malariae TaxID=5858 RepID=A0A1A8W6G3_PLAMA|nr:RNA and export factor binding protein, putative [Plasmodium malariae]